MEVEGEGEGPLALEPPAKKVEVAVLIAMPSPYRPQAWMEGTGTKMSSRANDSDKEEDVPDVVFGVAEVPMASRVRAEAGGPAEGHELE
ncbi:hypothetical protein SCHPADRAFT_901022 [Schizopora paradoxa]|uniref:Uncharacterized protein n=1 Tax=Schizopora paradoxa TaxID=27342 RepID=A0A0H2RY99_9AGAM|nr:hypothetical protein SCHPADRAFT_901022 [Schizopora paradoxa]